MTQLLEVEPLHKILEIGSAENILGEGPIKALRAYVNFCSDNEEWLQLNSIITTGTVTDAYDMKKGVRDCDIVMMLRLQNERMSSSYLSSNREYYEYYGLSPEKLEFAKTDALIMHPGPMNRGIEIDTMLADDINKSVIKEQVELGVAVRMACLKLYCK